MRLLRQLSQVILSLNSSFIHFILLLKSNYNQTSDVLKAVLENIWEYFSSPVGVIFFWAALSLVPETIRCLDLKSELALNLLDKEMPFFNATSTFEALVLSTACVNILEEFESLALIERPRCLNVFTILLFEL